MHNEGDHRRATRKLGHQAGQSVDVPCLEGNVGHGTKRGRQGTNDSEAATDRPLEGYYQSASVGAKDHLLVKQAGKGVEVAGMLAAPRYPCQVLGSLAGTPPAKMSSASSREPSIL